MGIWKKTGNVILTQQEDGTLSVELLFILIIDTPLDSVCTSLFYYYWKLTNDTTTCGFHELMVKGMWPPWIKTFLNCKSMIRDHWFWLTSTRHTSLFQRQAVWLMYAAVIAISPFPEERSQPLLIVSQAKRWLHQKMTESNIVEVKWIELWTTSGNISSLFFQHESEDPILSLNPADNALNLTIQWIDQLTTTRLSFCHSMPLDQHNTLIVCLFDVNNKPLNRIVVLFRSIEKFGFFLSF